MMSDYLFLFFMGWLGSLIGQMIYDIQVNGNGVDYELKKRGWRIHNTWINGIHYKSYPHPLVDIGDNSLDETNIT